VDTWSLIEAELVQVQDLKRQAEFVPDLLLRDYRRAGIVRLARIASQDQAPGTGK